MGGRPAPFLTGAGRRFGRHDRRHEWPRPAAGRKSGSGSWGRSPVQAPGGGCEEKWPLNREYLPSLLGGRPVGPGHRHESPDLFLSCIERAQRELLEKQLGYYVVSQMCFMQISGF